MQLLLPIAMLGAMWFLMIRPQQQRLREQRALVAALMVGDEVLTAGGLIGRVVDLDATELRLEVAPGTHVRVLRTAVTSKLGAPGEAA